MNQRHQSLGHVVVVSSWPGVGGAGDRGSRNVDACEPAMMAPASRSCDPSQTAVPTHVCNDAP